MAVFLKREGSRLWRLGTLRVETEPDKVSMDGSFVLRKQALVSDFVGGREYF